MVGRDFYSLDQEGFPRKNYNVLIFRTLLAICVCSGYDLWKSSETRFMSPFLCHGATLKEQIHSRWITLEACYMGWVYNPLFLSAKIGWSRSKWEDIINMNVTNEYPFDHHSSISFLMINIILWILLLGIFRKMHRRILLKNAKWN